jgi:hypothetical protein
MKNEEDFASNPKELRFQLQPSAEQMVYELAEALKEDFSNLDYDSCRSALDAFLTKYWQHKRIKIDVEPSPTKHCVTPTAADFSRTAWSYSYMLGITNLTG